MDGWMDGLVNGTMNKWMNVGVHGLKMDRWIN